jgi:hypothetical protein
MIKTAQLHDLTALCTKYGQDPSIANFIADHIEEIIEAALPYHVLLTDDEYEDLEKDANR